VRKAKEEDQEDNQGRQVENRFGTEGEMMNRFIRSSLIVFVVLVAGCVGGVSSVLAASPWQLYSNSRPANLKPGLATDEVQEIAVEAASGTFTLTVTTGTGHAAADEKTNVLTSLVTTGGSFRVGDALTLINGGGPGLLAANATATAIGMETLTMSQNAIRGNSRNSFDELDALETTAPIPAGASAGELENALAALPGLGAGNVEVIGATGGPYQVTLKGPLAYQPIALMKAGGSAPVVVSELRKGQADGEIAFTAANFGHSVVNTEKASVTLSETLPPGLEAVGIAGIEPGPEAAINLKPPIPCSLASLSCKFTGVLAPYDQLEMRVAVRVLPSASPAERDTVTVSGGNVTASSLSRSLHISEQPNVYGVDDWRLRAEEADGTLTTQAGSHPFQVTGSIILDQGPDLAPVSRERIIVEPVALPKNIITKIPAGLIGNPTPLPQCSMTLFLTERKGQEDECPQQTAIGVVVINVYEPSTFKSNLIIPVPLFNLEPYYGEPARFGFFVPGADVPVVLDTALRDGAGEDYGVNVIARNISQITGLASVRVTFWGVPGDPRHDDSRGWGCLFVTRGIEPSKQISVPPCKPSEDAHPFGFLTMPTSCGESLHSSVETDSWKEPEVFGDFPDSEPLQSLDGCNRLPFAPIISAEPTTDRASAPTGLDFNLNFNDEGLTSGEGIAQSQLNKTVVKLPEGLTINPSAGVGLGGCTPED
jgi:hypothetical protein